MNTVMKFLISCAVVLIAGCTAYSQSANNSAVWTWTAPSSFTDGTAIPSTDTITYNLYIGTSGKGSEPTTATQTGITAITLTTSGYTAGESVCGEVTAIVNGVESGRSNEACKNFPNQPNAPTNLTVK